MTAKILEFKKKSNGNSNDSSSKEEIKFDTIFDTTSEQDFSKVSFEEKKKRIEEERKKKNELVLRSYRIK